jgi:hypothetical protein
MVSTEPELDSDGRPRHSDPRDRSRPIVAQRKRNWLPWILAAIVLIGLALFALRPADDNARERAPVDAAAASAPPPRSPAT